MRDFEATTCGGSEGQHAAMIAALYDVVRRMIDARPHYTTSDNLQFLVARVTDIMNAHSCTLRLLDRDSGELRLQAQHGMSNLYYTKPPLKIGEAVAGTVFKDGRPEAVEDLLQDPRYKYRAHAAREGVRSLICAPLVGEHGPKGTLTVYFSQPKQFTDEHVQFFTLLANVLSIALHCADLYMQLTSHYLGTAEALVRAVEQKHPYTRGHSERVAHYATLIAEELGLPESDKEILRTAARLHDLGKLIIDLSILDKCTDLTKADFELVKRHPEAGAAILRPLPGFERHAQAIRSHHERLDGKGYPNGLHGDNIDVLTRIITVADAYDAMTSPRPYSPPYPHEKAARELLFCSGTQFWPPAVNALLRRLSHPVNLGERPALRVNSGFAKAGANPGSSGRRWSKR